MVMSSSARVWTAAEVREMQDESRAWPRFELIDGELIVTPSTTFLHQHAVGELLVALHSYLKRQNVGDVLHSPSDIEIVPETIMQPDVFVSPKTVGRRQKEWHDIQSLLLAAEIVSPSTATVDRVTKRQFLKRAPVDEYWVVDTDARIIERNRAGVEGVEILDLTLTWMPDGATEPLVLDLVSFFAEVHDEGRE